MRERKVNFRNDTLTCASKRFSLRFDIKKVLRL